jgi:hypothetical protein
VPEAARPDKGVRDVARQAEDAAVHRREGALTHSGWMGSVILAGVSEAAGTGRRRYQGREPGQELVGREEEEQRSPARTLHPVDEPASSPCESRCSESGGRRG